MVGDFMSNYLALDSRFGRTLKPFFSKPGELTKQFVNGKRRAYAHPVRMYLIASLVFFAVITQFSTQFITDLNGLNSESGKVDSKSVEESSGSNTGSRGFFSRALFTIKDINRNKLDSLAQMDRYTDAEVLDLATLRPLNSRERYAGIQMVRVMRVGDEIFVSYLLKNLSLMMILLIPFFALILKLFYYKKYYVTHIVHGLYLHSFAYTIFAFCYIVSILFLPTKMFIFPFLVAFSISTLYAFISFYRMYGQSWVTTLFKFSTIGFIYFSLLTVLFWVIMLVSLLLF